MCDGNLAMQNAYEIDCTDVPRLYYRMYQDIACVGDKERYCVIEANEIESMINEHHECCLDGGYPVFEPVYLTRKEFKDLPEFEGY